MLLRSVQGHYVVSSLGAGRHRVKMARLRLRKCVMRFAKSSGVQDNDGAVK